MKTVGLLHDLVSLEKAVSVSQKDIPLERQLAKWHNDGNLFGMTCIQHTSNINYFALYAILQNPSS